MFNKYSIIYQLSNKAARLQTRELEQCQLLFEKLDTEVQKLRQQGKKFLLRCDRRVYNLPVNIDEVKYFRPLFLMDTHTKLPEVQADDTHAVDFDVPVGTKVYAVESGVVTALECSKNEGGNNPDFAGEDNYLYVYNKEFNVMVCYRHLSPFNHIHLHQHIQTGDYLGQVGTTGYVITPHLHFVIYRYLPGKTYTLKSQKISFV